jgi:hypothetical protein
MPDQDSDPVSTFVTMDIVNHSMFHAIHLFVFPNLGCNEPVRLVLDGFGCLWLPGIVGDKAITKMNMGGLVAVIKGKAFEEEVLERLLAAGIANESTVIKVWPCSRTGIEFTAEAKSPASRPSESAAPAGGYIVVAPRKGKR